jgi:hypothetical protein
MTKKQYQKAMSTAPKGRSGIAYDKLNDFLDKNPDVTPIYWALMDALSLVECIANDEVEGHGKLPYTKLSGDQKIALIKEHARRMVVKAYRTGSI